MILVVLYISAVLVAQENAASLGAPTALHVIHTQSATQQTDAVPDTLNPSEEVNESDRKASALRNLFFKRIKNQEPEISIFRPKVIMESVRSSENGDDSALSKSDNVTEVYDKIQSDAQLTKAEEPKSLHERLNLARMKYLGLNQGNLRATHPVVHQKPKLTHLKIHSGQKREPKRQRQTFQQLSANKIEKVRVESSDITNAKKKVSSNQPVTLIPPFNSTMTFEISGTKTVNSSYSSTKDLKNTSDKTEDTADYISPIILTADESVEKDIAMQKMMLIETQRILKIPVIDNITLEGSGDTIEDQWSDIHDGQYHEVNPGQYHEINPGQYHEVNPGQYHEENPGQYHEVDPGQYHETSPGQEVQLDVEYNPVDETKTYNVHKKTGDYIIGEVGKIDVNNGQTVEGVRYTAVDGMVNQAQIAEILKQFFGS